MQNVPKIVRDRLQRPGSAAAESHPDADLLTAFAEHSLASGERDHVLQHLAQCGDCREIVHLALPASEVAAPHSFSSWTQAGWLRWPALRWGAVAAGVLAVMSIGVLRLNHRENRMLISDSLVQRNQLASAQQNAPGARSISVPPTATSLPSGEAGKHAETRKKAAVPAPGALSTDKAAISPSVIFPSSNQFHGRVSTNGGGLRAGSASGGSFRRDVPPGRSFASQSTDHATPTKQNYPPQSASETVEVSAATSAVQVAGAAPTLEMETTAQNGTQDQLVRDQAAENAQSSGMQLEAVVRAKPTSPVDGLAASDELRSNPTRVQSPTPRWTISATGALQRSLDGGKTWLDVELAASSMYSNLVGQFNSDQSKSEWMAAKSSQSRTVTKADAKSAPALPAPVPVIFRALAVSSNAAEVWAGGSAGVLYHTMDGGNLWLRVVPSDAGIALTGDIVRIQFSDTSNGTVTTSNSAWTTNDDGQSWHRQQ
jgi:Photosynthesis system II assembly factor YCF48